MGISFFLRHFLIIAYFYLFTLPDKNNIKLRSFKSSEHINKKWDGSYCSVTDPLEYVQKSRSAHQFTLSSCGMLSRRLVTQTKSAVGIQLLLTLDSKRQSFYSKV